jgi:hypothetical protein
MNQETTLELISSSPRVSFTATLPRLLIKAFNAYMEGSDVPLVKGKEVEAALVAYLGGAEAVMRLINE